MDIKRNYEYLLSDLKSIKGVGLKTSNLLKRKKINSIFDLLWNYQNPIRIEVYLRKLKI